MSITLKFRDSLVNNSLDLHFLPAKVNGEGPADVSNFFNCYTREQYGGILNNAVRGFPLKGEILKVPKTHHAFVMQESQNPLNTNKRRKLYVTGRFEKFHYWNFDKVPSKADAYKQAIQIFNLSEEITAAVSDIDLQDEFDRKSGKSRAKENSL